MLRLFSATVRLHTSLPEISQAYIGQKRCRYTKCDYYCRRFPDPKEGPSFQERARERERERENNSPGEAPEAQQGQKATPFSPAAFEQGHLEGYHN
jgi:hypothetical protein